MISDGGSKIKHSLLSKIASLTTKNYSKTAFVRLFLNTQFQYQPLIKLLILIYHYNSSKPLITLSTFLVNPESTIKINITILHLFVTLQTKLVINFFK
jgi:hypothetical protein